MLVNETAYGNDYEWFIKCFSVVTALTFILFVHETAQLFYRRKNGAKMVTCFMQHFKRKENMIEFSSLMFTIIYLITAFLHYITPMENYFQNEITEWSTRSAANIEYINETRYNLIKSQNYIVELEEFLNNGDEIPLFELQLTSIKYEIAETLKDLNETLENQEKFNYSIHNIKKEYRQFISHIYSGDFANDEYMNLTLHKIEDKMKSVSVLLRLLGMSNNDKEKNIEKLCCRSLKSREP